MTDIAAMSALAGAKPVTPPVAETRKLAPDDEVVDQFQRTLNPQAAGITAPNATGQPQRVGGTLGDAILSGIEGLSTDVRRTWDVVRSSTKADANLLKLGDLMALQTQVIQFSFLSEMLGKAVTKTAQDLDALVKMQ